VYSSNITFGVTSKVFAKEEPVRYAIDNIWVLLDKLRSRELTGNRAIGTIQYFISGNYGTDISFGNYVLILGCILDKNLKTRTGATLINKVLPGCIYTFSTSLANKLTPKLESKINFTSGEWAWSRKLDGVRLIVEITQDKVSYYSREGNPFTSLSNLDKSMQKIGRCFREYSTYAGAVYLDGEVSLQTEENEDDFRGIVSLVKRKNYTIENPRLNVFDMLGYDEFNCIMPSALHQVRMSRLNHILGLCSPNRNRVQMVEQTRLTSKKQFEEARELGRRLGWEGIMLRHNVPYENKRTNNLLKVKDMQDMEAVCTDVCVGYFRIIEDGVDKTILTLTSIIVDVDGVPVSVGSGFTLAERMQYMSHQELILNKKVTVQYFEKTTNDKGTISLRFPIFKGLRNYE